MRLGILAGLVLALTVSASAPRVAPAWSGHHGKHRSGCCCNCPQCGAYCKPSVKKEDEAKNCWEVECETVCIPRPVPLGEVVRLLPAGQVRPRAKKVNVLVQYEYKCPVCKYSFEPPKDRCCASCGQGRCSCQHPAAAMPAPAAPQPAPPAPPAAAEARRPTRTVEPTVRVAQ